MELPRQIYSIETRNPTSDVVPLRTREHQRPPSTELCPKNTPRTISSLPNELLDLIFDISLPYLDVSSTEWWQKARPCHPYLVALFALRRVSKTWKDLLDGSPSLWSVISSTFPLGLNQASLGRSGTCSLLIHYMDTTPRNSATSFQSFLQLVGPHLHRSSSVAIRLISDDALEFLNLESTRLADLNIQVVRKSSRVWPITNSSFPKQIDIPLETLKNIQGLTLSGAQLDWSINLQSLRDLRVLDLRGMFASTLASEQLLDLFAASPNLERFSLCLFRNPNDPRSDPFPTRQPISLPRLHSLKLYAGTRISDFILRNIEPPPNMISLDISPQDLPPSQVVTSFWMDAVAAWAPVVQRLHNKCQSVVRILSPETCELHGEDNNCRISLDMGNLPLDSALAWIGRHVGGIADSEGGRSIHVESWSVFLQGTDILAAIQSLPAVSKLSVFQDSDTADLTRMERVLKFLGEPIFPPSLPKLQKLVLYGWVWELDAIEAMIRMRYAMRETKRRSIVGLRVEIMLDDPWSEEVSHIWREKAIIHLSKVTALRAMEGVQGISIRCRSVAPGLLAVIWNEEKSAPGWV